MRAPTPTPRQREMMILIGADVKPHSRDGYGQFVCRDDRRRCFVLSPNGILLLGEGHLTEQERAEVHLLEQKWEDHDRKLAETEGRLTRDQAREIAFRLNNLHRTSSGPCSPAVCLVWACSRVWGVYSTVPLDGSLPEGALIFAIPDTLVNTDYVLDQVNAGRILQRPAATHA